MHESTVVKNSLMYAIYKDGCSKRLGIYVKPYDIRIFSKKLMIQTRYMFVWEYSIRKDRVMQIYSYQGIIT